MAPDFYEAVYEFARLRFVEGRFEEAAELFERASELDPDDYQSLSLSTMAYEHLGLPERSQDAARRAIERVERRVELAPGDVRAFYLGAGEAARLGLTERAREWADRALALDPHEHPTLYNVACVLARLGDFEDALDLLERVADAGFGHRGWIEQDTDLAPLHGHPRFAALLAKLR